MALQSELLITLQQLKGFGPKTILSIADSISEEILDITDLCDYWRNFKGKKFEKVTTEELLSANETARKILDTSKKEAIGVISYYNELFPSILRKCVNEKGNIAPPIVLYYRGNIDVINKKAVAIIGTRRPTHNGLIAGEQISKKLATSGYAIISGLAIGCDTAAHKGALAADQTTIAFLANGLDWASIYPKENRDLAKDIVAKNGLLLSEYPIGQKSRSFSLVARDRLQAGLANATIVVQSGIKGGTMHAVNATLHSNKPLFAIEYEMQDNHIANALQGNVKLIADKKAIPLNIATLEEAKQIISESINTKELVFETELFS